MALYGIRHSVKDHTDSERGNTLPPHRLLFPISSIYMHHPTDWITHTTAFVTPVPTWLTIPWYLLKCGNISACIPPLYR